MEQRLDYLTATPNVVRAMLGLHKPLSQSGLEKGLLDLVYFRVSQINGCAYCLDMHSKDLRAHGETEQRLYMLDAWRETPFFTEKERAALSWTESLTNIQAGHAPDEVYDELSRNFSEEERVNLTLAITTINAWNRIAIGFRLVPGNYQPAAAR